jgi:hypothetical protein
MARVIGPTPPGTGVIQPATSRTAVEVDVAAQLAGVVAVHADVDHHGAGLDHVGRHDLALAHGGHHDVGLARQRPRSGVPLWQMVTVALACSSSMAIGLPTMLLRPITTACLPLRIAQPIDSSMLHAAVGRAGAKAGLADHQRAGAGDVKAVDILGGGDGLDDGIPHRCARGSGNCTRMPCTAGSALSWRCAPAVRPSAERRQG